MTSKHDLRRDQRALRRSLASRVPGAAAMAAENLPADLRSAIVGGYLPVGSEMDPGPVLQHLVARGAKLALPVCLAPERPLIFRAFCAGDRLVPDAQGLAAPAPSAEVLVPDVLILPLLAFDAHGGRLGQGGGYYDRTLQAFRSAGRVWAIGLAYACQEVDCVPVDGMDQSLDAILTETGYIVPKRT